jgi:group I intron endonuclease
VNPLFYNRSNQTTTGFTTEGMRHSEETKRKMSEDRRGEKSHLFGTKASEASKKKMRDAKLGKKLSPLTCARMSESRRGAKNPMFGKKVSEDTREKMSTSKRGKNHPCYDATPYLWVHSDGREEFLQSYDLGVKYGIDSKAVRKVLNGKRNSIYGWRLQSEES